MVRDLASKGIRVKIAGNQATVPAMLWEIDEMMCLKRSIGMCEQQTHRSKEGRQLGEQLLGSKREPKQRKKEVAFQK